MLTTYVESYIKSFTRAYLDDYYIHIPSKKRYLFPNPGTHVQLIYESEIYCPWILSDSNGGSYIGRFPEWFKKHGKEFERAGELTIFCDKENNKYQFKIS
jgi:hypothetical protein